METETDEARDAVAEQLSTKGVDRLLLSTRLEKEPGQPVLCKPEVGEIVDSTFGKRLLERKVVRRWPGTELIGHNGLVFVISFDASLIESMVALGGHLDLWEMSNEPPLPEDLCLYRQGDEWPVLVSVTHELDAWLLSDSRPPFCPGEPFEFRPDRLYVPEASGGFVGD